jgi:hypothetical protein
MNDDLGNNESAGFIEIRDSTVYCTVQWEGIHHWNDAPDEVGFLRHPHRHQFEATLHVSVEHSDRDVEFIMLKRSLSRFVKERLQGYVKDASCEDMCNCIARAMNGLGYRVRRVQVSEDGENGADVRYRYRPEPSTNTEASSEAEAVGSMSLDVTSVDVERPRLR